ncbi:MAG: response regulator [Deltaproteobacteria bacterium]|nr:response regulator [Deltaproteobacteria bacterium]
MPVTKEAIPIMVDDLDTRPISTTARPILVIDDVPANLYAMEVALAPLKRTVVMASSGTQALAHLLERDFALVLLDVQMPEMDGLETAALIRSRERTKHLPIIFVTAHHDSPASVRRAYALGAVDFLYKPIEPEILLAKAAVYVTLQDQAEELAAERLRHDFEEARREYETQALRRQVEQEQTQLTALAALDRRKDDFLAILAHELRNPLAPIRTAIELLRTRPDLSDKAVDVLDRQSRQLARLVDDLLDVSRIKANKIELRREVQDLREIIESSVTTSRPRIEERGHELTVDLPAERIPVNADHVRVTQILTNLLNNAARYTDIGGSIHVRCSVEGRTATITVSDTGIGIAPELQTNIFEMFVQERVRSDGSGGLGLGLALARQLVEMHGGTIRAQSEGRGKGSRFVVTLPTVTTAIVTRRPTLPPPAMTALRAVVIDDNADARELLCEMLAAHGHLVMSAADGKDGLALIQQHRPDVAIVDLGLPGMDGLALARVLRESCPDLTTRLVALTGYGHDNDRERTKAAGFDRHLVKPASLADILASMASQTGSALI